MNKPKRFAFSVKSIYSAYIDTVKGSNANDYPTIVLALKDKIESIITTTNTQLNSLLKDACIVVETQNPSIRYLEDDNSTPDAQSDIKILDTDMRPIEQSNEPEMPKQMTLKEAIQFIIDNPGYKMILDSKKELTSENQDELFVVVKK